MKANGVFCLLSLVLLSSQICAQGVDSAEKISRHQYDRAKLVWMDSPASKWYEALPVGNGRLGGMLFGGPAEEHLQLNEDTYWTGGPYSTVVKGGYKYLPEVRKLVFEGKFKEAQALFGRKLMGYPVEQQKYQSLANLMLFFNNIKEVKDYKRWARALPMCNSAAMGLLTAARFLHPRLTK
jgi:alpha-L-fucosidase 2